MAADVLLKVYVSESEALAIQHLAEEECRSVSGLMRYALRLYLRDRVREEEWRDRSGQGPE